jgi:RHS repeat-associated protein
LVISLGYWPVLCPAAPVVCPGDINSDGWVNEADLSALSDNWLRSDCQEPDWCVGADVDRDGKVNLDEFAAVSQRWQQQCPLDLSALYEPPCQEMPYASPCDCRGGCGPGSDFDNPTHGVLLHSGEFTHRVVDLRIRGRGIDFIWGRIYRSRLGEVTTMGHNWNHSYDICVEACGPDRLVRDGNGRQDLYLLQADGAWGKDGFFRALEENPDGTHTMVFSDTGKWEFHAPNHPSAPGKIRAIVDRNGNAIALDYDGAGRLTEIRDTLNIPAKDNRVVTLSYNPDGFIESVTDFTGRQVLYDYYMDGDNDGSAGDLKSVRSPVVVGTPHNNDFPNGKTTFYTYTKGHVRKEKNHNLRTITDAKGQLYLRNLYFTEDDPTVRDFDRLRRQFWGDAEDVIDVRYRDRVPGPSNNFSVVEAIVNDRVGNVREYSYDAMNRLTVRKEFTGRADPNMRTEQGFNRPTGKLRPDDPDSHDFFYAYNEDSMLTCIEQPENDRVEILFPPRDPNSSRRSWGNLLELRRVPGPRGGDQAEIVERFEYDLDLGGCCGSNFVTRQVDGRGNETLHDYDQRGNRLRTTHRIPSIVEDFKYNDHGQLTRHVLPGNGSGHRRVDVYTYYHEPNDPATGPMFGYLRQLIVDHLHDDPNDPPDPPAVTSHFELTTTFEYNDVGIITKVIDPEGHDTQIVVNELDQPVRRISREVQAGGGVRYQRDIFYDFNNNVVRSDVENIDEAGALQANTHYSTILEYEILNQPIRVCREAGEYVGAIPGIPELPTCIGLPEGDFITTEYDYDDNRNRTRVRSGEAVEGRQLNNVVKTLYDERDLLFQTIRAPGDPNQSSDQVDYDTNGNIKRITRGLEDVGNERVTLVTYDGYNRPKTAEDPMGNITTTTYNANHRVVSQQLDGELLDLPGNAANVRLSDEMIVYDFMDRRTQRDVAFFDPATQADIGDGQSTTTWSWADTSQLLAKTNDNNHALSTTYDTANRIDVRTDAAGNAAAYTWNSNSFLTSLTETDKSALGNPDQDFTTSYGRDDLDRLVSVADNLANTTGYGLDSRSNRTRVTDALNNETRIVYDGINRELKTVRDLNDNGAEPNALPGDIGPDIVTTQIYDDNSRVIGRTDDNGNTTTYNYDALNRQVGTVYADGTANSLAYDVHHNPVTRIDANGSVQTCGYDLLDRLINKAIIPGAGVSADTTFEMYDYDGRSLRVSADDNDAQVAWTYDSLLNRTGETLTINTASGLSAGTTLAAYDGVGNMVQCTYPGGRVIDCTYDQLERIGTITDVTGAPDLVAAHFYVGPGRLERRDFGNGTRTDVFYDGITGVSNPAGDFGVKRVIGTRHTRIAGGDVLDDRTYSWDRQYNKTQRRDVRAGGPQLTHDYAYDDSIYRLVQSSVTDAVLTLLDQIDYTLDGDGNRTNVTGGPNPGAYVLDAAAPNPADAQVNQYTGTSFDARLYDLKGNLTVIDDNLSTEKNMQYDYLNRMVEVTDAQSSQRHTYAYDALGRRIVRVVDADGAAQETRYFYTGLRVIEEQEALGATQATYVYGAYIDDVLNMQRGAADSYYHSDDLYNVMVVSDDAGNVVERYDYDDYGDPLLFDGAGIPIAASTIGNPYLFNGRRYDPETGWYHYRNRYLDPRAGRFTTRDPIGLRDNIVEKDPMGLVLRGTAVGNPGDALSIVEKDPMGIWGDAQNVGNGYTYVGNNPVRYLDPLGNQQCEGERRKVYVSYEGWGDGKHSDFQEEGTGTWYGGRLGESDDGSRAECEQERGWRKKNKEKEKPSSDPDKGGGYHGDDCPPGAIGC